MDSLTWRVQHGFTNMEGEYSMDSLTWRVQHGFTNMNARVHMN